MSITNFSHSTANPTASAFIPCAAADFDIIGFQLLDAAAELNACVADADQVQVSITESTGPESAFGELLLTVTANDERAALSALAQLMDGVTEAI